MRGAVAVTRLLACPEVVKGADKLTLYRFNTNEYSPAAQIFGTSPRLDGAWTFVWKQPSPNLLISLHIQKM